MTTVHQNTGRESGAVSRLLLMVLALLVIGGIWFYLDDDAGAGLKRDAKLKTMEMIGEMAVSKLSSVPSDSDGTHGSAVDMIKLPIEVRKVTDAVYYATGVANTVMVTTSEGNVIFDTGLIIQAAKQLRLLKEQVSDGPVSNVILSHSHADHVGGAGLWLDQGTKIIAHQQFEEELRYLEQLKPYLYGRNRTLFPWMPEEPANIGMLEYGSIKPDVTVGDTDIYSFILGGVEFQVVGAPGAEGADNIVLWLPQQKILVSGDFFGPQFPQFPNIFTMRGEKVRKPMEYVASLDKLIALQPEIVIPSHLGPTVGAAEIHANMVRIRDAVKYVHDETVAGMNAGKDVYQLMKEIKLPANLDLVQNHGRVDWAVKSIWEYYTTWFHYDSTTELYPVPAKDVYADLAAVAGPEALHSLAKNYLHKDEPVKALHIVEVALKGYPRDLAALALRQQALQRLMDKAEAGTRNDYEIYWLKSRLADTQERLDSAH